MIDFLEKFCEELHEFPSHECNITSFVPSSLSSSLNSCAACLYKDMIEYVYPQTNEDKKLLFNKAAGASYLVYIFFIFSSRSEPHVSDFRRSSREVFPDQ